MAIPLATVEADLSRRVGHDRKAQLGIRRHAGWRARLAPAAEDFHNFPKAGLADPRMGGIQVEDAPG